MDNMSAILIRFKKWSFIQQHLTPPYLNYFSELKQSNLSNFCIKLRAHLSNLCIKLIALNIVKKFIRIPNKFLESIQDIHWFL
jgi:hypothetical protein